MIQLKLLQICINDDCTEDKKEWQKEKQSFVDNLKTLEGSLVLGSETLKKMLTVNKK